MLQRHGDGEHRISMREMRSTVERIDVPAVIAALIVQPLLFAQHVMRGKLLADAFANQRFGSTVCRRHQIGVAFVFNLQTLMEILQQQSTRLASDGRHGWEKAVVGSVGHRFGFWVLGLGCCVLGVRSWVSWTHGSLSLKPKT